MGGRKQREVGVTARRGDRDWHSGGGIRCLDLRVADAEAGDRSGQPRGEVRGHPFTGPPYTGLPV